MYQFFFLMSLGKHNFRFKFKARSWIRSQQPIVNGSNLSSVFLLWLKIHIWLFNIKKGEGKFLGIVCFEILYNQSEGWIKSNQKGERLSFRKRIKKNRIQDTSTKKKFSNPTLSGKFFIYFFVSFWRYGRVVRRGTANPFSPVQIRVSPDQQKTRNLLFCSADI